ncbi:hypothetical protein [Paenibacillus sp. FSL H8-0537]
MQHLTNGRRQGNQASRNNYNIFVMKLDLADGNWKQKILLAMVL